MFPTQTIDDPLRGSHRLWPTVLRRGWPLLALLAVAPVVVGCGGTPTPPAPARLPEVRVGYPVVQEVTDFEDFTGQTQAVSTITIRARVTGYLDKVCFKEGAEVLENDLLFQIDPRPYQAQLDQDRADLENKRAAVDKAAAVYRRTLALRRTGASAQEDIDNQEGDWKVARAAVGQAEAKVRASQLNLDWTQIRAPVKTLPQVYASTISLMAAPQAGGVLSAASALTPGRTLCGRISRQLIDPGNLVMADQTALTTIVSVDPMYVYFDIDERTVLRVRRMLRAGKIKGYQQVEMPVHASLSDEDDFAFKGLVNFVDNQNDSKTGTLRVRGIFSNAQRLLTPGLFVRVRLPIGTAHDSVLITEKALGTDQGQKFLYVVNDQDEVVYRKVKIGSLTNGLRVIEDGLHPGERVIVSGLQRVRPGAKVDAKPVDMTAQKAGPSRAPVVAAAR